jgi:hypothetical protein
LFAVFQATTFETFKPETLPFQAVLDAQDVAALNLQRVVAMLLIELISLPAIREEGERFNILL